MSEDNLTDLGWANGWSARPDLVVKCEEKGHARKSTDEGRIKNYGYDTVTRCFTCGYKFHTDSSD